LSDPAGGGQGTGEPSERTAVEKLTIYVGLTLGGIIGGYLPVALFQVGAFSWQSLICSFIGCIIGTWLGWKLTLWIES
jgi:hypothetical protein